MSASSAENVSHEKLSSATQNVIEANEDASESTGSKKSSSLKTSQDIEKAAPGVAEDDATDPNIVWWDGINDPEDPMNWKTSKKAGNVLLLSAMCFITPLASSMFAPGVLELMQEFQSRNVELASFVVSVYVLGFAAGPMVFAPASEMYGRLIIYQISNVLFLLCTVACALSTSLTMLIIFRFLAGTFGSVVLTNGGASMADMIQQEKRVAVMSLFVIGPLLGPIMGPVAGGYLTDAKGWRWVFWVISIVSGVVTVLSFFLLSESYAPVLLKRKTLRLQKETGNLSLRSKLDSNRPPKELFIHSIIRPSKFLLFCPPVLIFSIYIGVVYGYLYLLFTTFAVVFEGTYGFSSGTVGLTYLGLGLGSMVGLVIFGLISKRIMSTKGVPAADGSGRIEMKPEYRLPPMLPGSLLIPIGLFIYGWTAQYKVHYMVPIFGTLLIGAGNLAVMMSINLYIIDSYTLFSASALAATTLVRSVLGATLPLAGQSMYDTLGLGWGNSLLAFIAIALLPVTLALWKYGEQLRKRFPVENFI